MGETATPDARGRRWRDVLRPELSSRRRAVALVAGACALIVGLWQLVVASGWHPGPLSWLVALTPWSLLIALVGLALAALARSMRDALICALMAALVVVGQLPLYTAAPDPGGERFTVATINMLFGQADPREVVAMVEEHDVDVLSVQELTPEAEAGLLEAGLADLMPYSVARQAPRAAGTGLWSRTPIADGERIDALILWAVAGSIELAGESIRVVAVHPVPPGPRDSSTWERELDTLVQILDSLGGPVIAAGDFNTTRDHAGFRELEARGFVDAADQAGAGFQPTFPQERLPWPLVVIDHVMVRAEGVVAVDVATAVIDGADHRALVVEYATSP